jgi:hypothetical protein
MGNHLGYHLYYGGGSDLKNSENESLLERLDYIVSHYILTMDFDSLKKLYDKNYCNKLVSITSDIFDKYFTDLEIERISKHRLNEVKETKFDECKKISVFYIKIAHLFAAIVMTINPEYMYYSGSRNLIKNKLSEKNKIPNGSKIKIATSNFCGKRINILKKGVEKENPFCYFNLMENSDVKTFNEEPGIPELMHLYYDDGFDYKSGNFSNMSEDSKEQFRKDLHAFYREFTGEDNVPSNITKFADIKLRNYGNFNCSDEKIPIDKTLFAEYANNLKKMIISAKEKQEQLLQIINKLFISHENSEGKQYIRIHPHLTDQELQKFIENTRELIIELYLKCESDFTNGLQLYEAIIESRIFQTTQMQINTLKQSQEKFVQDLK